MIFRRLFGPDETTQPAAGGPSAPPETVPGETETVRRIVASLEAMPQDQARYLAGFAYILSRAAEADMDISAAETGAMERIVVEYGGLTEAQAVIVVEIAKTQARLHGGTEDFLVTREFTRIATEDQRLALMRCCFIVAASESISAEESAVLSEIANELNLDDQQIARIRGEFTDQFAAVQAMRASLGS
jgi:uncharacterized tellurite resistance protein B-like protein